MEDMFEDDDPLSSFLARDVDELSDSEKLNDATCK